MEPKCSYCEIFGQKPHCHRCKIIGDMSKHTAKEIDSFENLITSLDNGAFYDSYGVGDFKDVPLLTGEVVRIYIIGIDHDKLANSNNTATVSFGILSTDFCSRANDRDTNEGSYPASKLKTVIDRYLTLLPSVIADRIVPVIKRTSSGRGNSNIIEHEEKLWAFSEAEIRNRVSYSFTGEGEIYEFFDGANKYNLFNPYYTYLRSPYCRGEYSFVVVFRGGGVNYDSAGSTCGLAFGFSLTSNPNTEINNEQ